MKKSAANKKSFYPIWSFLSEAIYSISRNAPQLAEGPKLTEVPQQDEGMNGQSCRHCGAIVLGELQNRALWINHFNPPCSSPYGGLWGTLALSPTPPVASGR
jgi:hypothetical protein